VLAAGTANAVDTWWLPEYYVPDQLLYPQQTRGFHFGPLDIYPRVSTSAVYDDNVNYGRSGGVPGQQTAQSDLTWSVSPGVSVVLGEGEEKILTLSYTPAFVFYTEHSQYDSIDHSASLHGVWPFSKLTLGFTQGIQVRSGGYAEVAARVDQRSYTTGVTSRYEMGEKTSFEVNGSQYISDFGGGQFYSSKTWANDNWFNYAVLAKVTTGVGFGLGYSEADQQPNQTFERASIRASYALAAKVSVAASVGGEWRQYDRLNRFGPIFSLSGAYTPREGTSLTLEGHRSEANSAVLAGQDYISTGFGAGIGQRVWTKYFFHLNAGYDNLEYVATTQGVVASRQDNTYQVRAGVDTVIFRRLSTGLFYQYHDNISNDANYHFAGSQVGIVASYSF